MTPGLKKVVLSDNRYRNCPLEKYGLPECRDLDFYRAFLKTITNSTVSQS